MNNLDLAYLAGVIDGDGSISIMVDRWRVGRLTCQGTIPKNPAYQELVAIGQVDLPALQLLQNLFGGNIRKQKKRGENRKPLYLWMAGNRRAVVVIRALLPYLRIKCKQADIVLQLRDIKDRDIYKRTQKVIGTRARSVRPEVFAEMEALVKAVRQLNDTRFPITS